MAAQTQVEELVAVLKRLVLVETCCYPNTLQVKAAFAIVQTELFQTLCKAGDPSLYSNRKVVRCSSKYMMLLTEGLLLLW